MIRYMLCGLSRSALPGLMYSSVRWHSAVYPRLFRFTSICLITSSEPPDVMHLQSHVSMYKAPTSDYRHSTGVTIWQVRQCARLVSEAVAAGVCCVIDLQRLFPRLYINKSALQNLTYCTVIMIWPVLVGEECAKLPNEAVAAGMCCVIDLQKEHPL